MANRKDCTVELGNMIFFVRCKRETFLNLQEQQPDGIIEIFTDKDFTKKPQYCSISLLRLIAHKY